MGDRYSTAKVDCRLLMQNFPLFMNKQSQRYLSLPSIEIGELRRDVKVVRATSPGRSYSLVRVPELFSGTLTNRPLSPDGGERVASSTAHVARMQNINYSINDGVVYASRVM